MRLSFDIYVNANIPMIYLDKIGQAFMQDIKILDERMPREINKFQDDGAWSAEKLEIMRDEHLRTPYKHKVTVLRLEDLHDY